MRLVIKPNKGLGKIEVELSGGETWAEVERLSERYGVPPERIIEIALVGGEFKKPGGETSRSSRGGRPGGNSRRKPGNSKGNTPRSASGPTVLARTTRSWRSSSQVCSPRTAS